MFRAPVLVHWLGLGWVRPRLNITRMHHRHHTISLKGMQHHTISLVADKIRKGVLLIKQGPTLSSSNTPFFAYVFINWLGSANRLGLARLGSANRLGVREMGSVRPRLNIKYTSSAPYDITQLVCITIPYRRLPDRIKDVLLVGQDPTLSSSNTAFVVSL